MTSTAIVDYLTKELAINKNIVTYRTLSRHFSLHVNAAKEELASFRDAESETGVGTIYATYWISGVVTSHTPTQSTDEGMDIDDAEDDDEAIALSTIKIALASECDLEATKSTFERVITCHIYCLSPSPLIDADLIHTTGEQVQKLDYARGLDFSRSLGRVISKDVKLSTSYKLGKGKAIPAAGPSSAKALPAVAKIESKTVTKEATIKPKAGTLDWSKAKAPKPPKKEEENQLLTKDGANVNKQHTPTKAVAEKSATKTTDELKVKRGHKRKSDVMGLNDKEEDEQPASVTASPNTNTLGEGVKIKKGAIISDDEDDGEMTSTAKSNAAFKGKSKALPIDPEVERSLRAMMDIDDDQVVRVTHTAPAHEEMRSEDEQEIQTATEDVDMEDALVKPKPRKRKEKKVIPVGRNGLKKKRVIKSRVETDEKGYIATIDYSDYESVDEEEPEPEKIKKEPKKITQSEPKDAKPAKKPIKASGTTKKPTQKKSLPGGVNSLNNYFGAKS